MEIFFKAHLQIKQEGLKQSGQAGTPVLIKMTTFFMAQYAG